MNTRLKLADNLAVVALVLAAAAAAAGLLVTGLYRDTAEGIRQTRATDLVTLAVAVPTMAVSLWRAQSGSVNARFIVIAALGYLAYSYAIDAFSVIINPLTPVHIGILGLATWSLIFNISGLEDVAIDDATRLRLPHRTTGGFLIVVAALFALLWLSQILGAITSGTLPPAVADLHLPTSAVYVLDLAFAVPLLLTAGGWLIRHDRRGPASGVASLAFLVLLGLSVLAIFGVDAAAGVAAEAAPIVIFGVVTSIAALLLAIALSTSRMDSVASRS